MRRPNRILLLALTVLAFVTTQLDPARAQTAGGGTNLGGGPNVSNTPSTVLQKSIAKSIADRRAQGLPVPAGVSFTVVPQSAPPNVGPGEDGATSGQVVIEAKTVLRFDGPEQAGNTQWPALVVSGDMPPGAHGTIVPGDYSQAIKEKLAQQLPGIWDQYEFGHEPRVYTIVETFKYKPGTTPASPLSPGAAAFGTPLVMGFTVLGPDLDYTLNWGIEVCVPVAGCATLVKFRAGFQLDWGLGLRLPMDLDVASESPYLEGSTYVPTSTVHGDDFTATQFSALGVAPEDGNELVLRFDFTLGVFLEVLGSNVIDIGFDLHPDKSSSFATPFGPGSSFPIPAIEIPLYHPDITVASLEIGFKLDPELGSDKFTANWQVTGEASGSGSLTYNDPAVPVSLASVNAIDGPGFANFRIDDPRYYFNKFLLDLSIFVKIDVFGIGSSDFDIPITDFDLGALTGSLSVGPHDGTAGVLTGSVPILNVPPTAVIDKTGTTLVHGIPTFMGETGTPMSFSGSSHDPGRDDLTLSWDFGDGAPSPDVITTYPVPHDVTDTHSHVFTQACLFSVGFRSVDDDQASAEDHVNVLILSSTRDRARLDGYWQELMAGNGSGDIDPGSLSCMLGLVGYLSSVFDEVRDASTPAKAYDVLHMAQNGGSARDKFDRELLVTWLNLAQGVFGWSEMLDTNGDGVLDTPFSSVIGSSESVRLAPGSTDAAFKAQEDLLHKLNVSRTGKAFAKKAGTGDGQTVSAGRAFEGIRAASAPGHSIDISFALAMAGEARLEIFDVGGRVVRTFEGTRDAGVQTIHWDGATDSGPAAMSGVYFLRAVLDGRSVLGKAVLLR